MREAKLTVGTRGSALALWQANHVVGLLKASHPEREFDIKVIRTSGDRNLEVALSKVGGKGLFTKELERALLAGEVDLCVHSMKDVPTVLPEGLAITAMLPRADARDALIGFRGLAFAELPAGSRVATGSLRRTAQLSVLRPDIAFCDIRGNVETRIGKVRDGMFDAAVLAVAGVERMSLGSCIAERFPTDVMVPAVGQGAIGIETREEDEDVLETMAAISCDDTLRDVGAERIVMRALEGGCQVPLGAYAREKAGTYSFDAFVSSIDGSRVARTSLTGCAEASRELALQAVDELLSQGALDILEAMR